MTSLTRPGADLGAIALPSTSFAFDPFTPESDDPDVPVPPLLAIDAGLRVVRAIRQVAANAPAERRHSIRNGFENINRPPSSAYGVSCRAGAKGDCAPARVGRVSPNSWFPRSSHRSARIRLLPLLECGEVSERGRRGRRHATARSGECSGTIRN